MKKAWRKLQRQELLYDFIMCGLLVLFGGGSLLYLIVSIADKPAGIGRDIQLIGFFAAIIFVLILLSGFTLYRITASHIRRYKRILDFVPTPVIITDKDARWRQINAAAREIMNLEPHRDPEELYSRHLINADGVVSERLWVHKGTKYRITGYRLGDRQDDGYVILLTGVNETSDTGKTRDELIDEINGLFGRLSTATDHFHDCADTIAGCTVRQAGIISELSDVIAGIASGEYTEPGAINEKMVAVQRDMQHHVESSVTHLEKIQRTVEALDAARDSISGVLHDIDSVL